MKEGKRKIWRINGRREGEKNDSKDLIREQKGTVVTWSTNFILPTILVPEYACNLVGTRIMERVKFVNRGTLYRIREREKKNGLQRGRGHYVVFSCMVATLTSLSPREH